MVRRLSSAFIAATALALQGMGCLPADRAVTSSSTEPVQLGRRWAGPHELLVHMRASSGTLIVTVIKVRSCEVLERADVVTSERVKRSPSYLLIVPGALLGGVGVSWSLEDEQSIEGDVSRTVGPVFLLTGLGMVALGFAIATDKTEQTIEQGPTQWRIEGDCERLAGANLPVTVEFEDGAKIAGMTNETGVATIPLDPKTWAARSGGLRGKVYVQGKPVRPFSRISSAEQSGPP